MSKTKKYEKSEAAKAAGRVDRLSVSNINQKAGPMEDRRTRRQRTRSEQNRKAIEESKDEG